MKMLLGLVHPTGGSVELLGHTLNEANRIALLRQTGSLIESPSGYLHLTARENLSIVADLKDVDRKDISRVLEIVHLTKDADRKVGQYSLGMKQRLGIAMALLGSPKLLILDEPTNGLDPAGIQEMRALIAGMPRACGTSVLISSHLLSELACKFLCISLCLCSPVISGLLRVSNFLGGIVLCKLSSLLCCSGCCKCVSKSKFLSSSL